MAPAKKNEIYARWFNSTKLNLSKGYNIPLRNLAERRNELPIGDGNKGRILLQKYGIIKITETNEPIGVKIVTMASWTFIQRSRKYGWGIGYGGDKFMVLCSNARYRDTRVMLPKYENFCYSELSVVSLLVRYLLNLELNRIQI